MLCWPKSTANWRARRRHWSQAPVLGGAWRGVAGPAAALRARAARTLQVRRRAGEVAFPAVTTASRSWGGAAALGGEGGACVWFRQGRGREVQVGGGAARNVASDGARRRPLGGGPRAPMVVCSMAERAFAEASWAGAALGCLAKLARDEVGRGHGKEFKNQSTSRRRLPCPLAARVVAGGTWCRGSTR